MTELGQVEEGIAQMHRRLATYEAIGAEVGATGFLWALADGYRKARQVEEGLAVVSEGLASAEKTGERFWEAQLHHVKGMLLLMQGDEAEAEASFHKAIEVARRQQAKSWELRATVSLCRLWQEQGRIDEARQMLTEIYGWFTEGFDTSDLKDARALLEELSCN